MQFRTKSTRKEHGAIKINSLVVLRVRSEREQKKNEPRHTQANIQTHILGQYFFPLVFFFYFFLLAFPMNNKYK